MYIFLVAFAEEFPNVITPLEMYLMSSLQWVLWRWYFYWGNYKSWTCAYDIPLPPLPHQFEASPCIL